MSQSDHGGAHQQVTVPTEAQLVTAPVSGTRAPVVTPPPRGLSPMPKLFSADAVIEVVPWEQDPAKAPIFDYATEITPDQGRPFAKY